MRETRSLAGARDQEPSVQVQEVIQLLLKSDEFFRLEDRSTGMVLGSLVLRPYSCGLRYGASLNVVHP